MARKVAAIVKKYDGDKGQLVSMLQDIQTEYHYLPKDALDEMVALLGVPASQVYSVATFFKAFSLTPRGRHLIKVCLGTACHVRGAAKVVEKMELDLGVKRTQTPLTAFSSQIVRSRSMSWIRSRFKTRPGQ